MFNINPKAVLEDVIVPINSWKYIVDFIFFKPKKNVMGIHSSFVYG